MPTKPTKAKMEKRKLKALHPFPRQHEFFADMADQDLEGLAKSYREGQAIPPIEVLAKNKAGLAANTILRGHQRRKALELNGDTEAMVLVRYDLAAADMVSIEREFLVDNLQRRHQDPLARARVALEFFKLSRKHPESRLVGQEAEDARDMVGKTINMSGRNLQRYWNILRAPIEIQDAFRAGHLTLVVASRIGCLFEEKQIEIAARIKAGEQPRAVARDCLSSSDGRQVNVQGALRVYFRAQQKGADAIKERLDEIRHLNMPIFLPLLKRAKDLLDKLLKMAERRQKKRHMNRHQED